MVSLKLKLNWKLKLYGLEKIRSLSDSTLLDMSVAWFSLYTFGLTAISVQNEQHVPNRPDPSSLPSLWAQGEVCYLQYFGCSTLTRCFRLFKKIHNKSTHHHTVLYFLKLIKSKLLILSFYFGDMLRELFSFGQEMMIVLIFFFQMTSKMLPSIKLRKCKLLMINCSVVPLTVTLKDCADGPCGCLCV